jgi:DNA-directed RNA polymerase subunit N (RpoN/RPB10)
MTIEPIPRGARVKEPFNWDSVKKIPCPKCGRVMRPGVYALEPPEDYIYHITFHCPRCGLLDYIVETGAWCYATGKHAGEAIDKMYEKPKIQEASFEQKRNIDLAFLLGPMLYQDGRRTIGGQEKYAKDPDFRIICDVAYDELVRRMTLNPERCIICGEPVVEPFAVYCKKCLDISDEKKEKIAPDRFVKRDKRLADQAKLFAEIRREIIDRELASARARACR